MNKSEHEAIVKLAKGNWKQTEKYVFAHESHLIFLLLLLLLLY